MMNRKFAVQDTYGEIDAIFKTDDDSQISTVIANAWNYECHVSEINSDGVENLIFYPWSSDEENSEILSDYGLEIVTIGSHRYVKELTDNIICILDYQRNQFFDDIEKEGIVVGMKVLDEYTLI